MCTAATYKTKDFYFGRKLDYEFSYGDEITITPRNYEFKFKETEQIKNHYAIIGMAYVAENYPLYYDAINEKGLGIAGLNFVGNTHYNSKKEGKDNDGNLQSNGNPEDIGLQSGDNRAALRVIFHEIDGSENLPSAHQRRCRMGLYGAAVILRVKDVAPHQSPDDLRKEKKLSFRIAGFK